MSKKVLLANNGSLNLVTAKRDTTEIVRANNITAQSVTNDKSFDRQMIKSERVAGRDLLQQGQRLYQTGKVQRAIQTWQEAAKIFAVEENTLNQALALSYIATGWEHLGEWERGQKAIAEGQKLLESKDNSLVAPILARLFNVRGQLELSQGKETAALTSWERAETLYREVQDTEGVIGTRLNQARALQTLGLYRRSQKVLATTIDKIAESPDSLLKATVLNSWGKIHWHLGDLEQAREILEHTLQIAEKLAVRDSAPTLELSLLQSDTLLSMGNTLRLQEKTQPAFEYYQKGIAISPTPTSKITIRANQLSLLVKTKQWRQAQKLWLEIKPLLTQLSNNRQTNYTYINIAESLISFRKQNRESDSLAIADSEIIQLLDEAIVRGKKINDVRTQSTAIGVLGYWYEYNRQWKQAQKSTDRALSLAEIHNLPEIAYRWQWQLGRLNKVRGNKDNAIAHYEEAVKTLQSLRRDLVSINTEIQFSFQERVEPVYRQLVELLLEPDAKGKIPQQNLQQARQIVESLQIAELENFFHEVCLRPKETAIDRIQAQTAIVYPIILPHKLSVILSLPDRPLDYYETKISQTETEALLIRMRQSLRQTSFATERLPIARQVYDLLIRPAESKLIDSKVDNLAFVLDGMLKTIPMAALYDGRKYLLEKYSIALAPSIQLLESRPLKTHRLKGLIGALSESRQGFIPLPGVIQEIEQVSSQIATQILLNREFTRDSIHRQVEDSTFPVVHLATHGQFSSSAEKTFILAWDGKIKVKKLAEWLQTRGYDTENPIQLLVLSACETAFGDRRAALGMAGVAVRSGVRTTIASLWSVQDNSTALLMTKFYQELSQNQSNKAEALRRAQIALLEQPEYQHPFYWASFVSIGNWM